MSTDTEKMVDDDDSPSAESIASLCLSTTQPYCPIQLSQTKHRLNICQQWKIPHDSTILEIGCGQGDCTAVLASLIGPQGHVTALDPADLSYGSPLTLGQAQTHLRKSSVGPKITFIQDNPIHFLETTTENYDYAILFHSVWYFTDSEEIERTFRALYGRVNNLCIVEYTLHGSTTHLLSVLAQAACDRRDRLTANVRTVVSKKAIIERAYKAGWTRIKMEFEVKPELADGRWEVNEALNLIENQAKTEVICALKDALLESLEEVDGLEKVQTLNVWSTVFTRE